MRYYSYKAITPDGSLIRGTVAGEDIDYVYGILSSNGLYILNVKAASTLITNLKKSLWKRNVKNKDVIEFANNLSVMLKAGIPLMTALTDIISGIENKTFKNAMTDIRAQIETGMRFSDAVASKKGIFPEIFASLIKVGEETGDMEKSLSDAADHMQRMEDLALTIRRALIYPAFALIATSGALIFWLAYVLPKVISAMKDMGIELPLITRMLLAAGDFVQAYWYFIPVPPLAVFIAIRVLNRKSGSKYYIDEIKLKLPIMGIVVYNKLLALFSEQLRILVVAGLTINKAFDIVADLIGNEVFKRAILEIKDSISSGSRISDALREHIVFPSLVARMIDAGETSGNLDKQLAYLSGFYFKRLDDISQKIGKMIEPVVITLVGIIFAVIIIGLLFPVYDLVIKLGRG
ncbi:MAG: type II secretion system F family protein [Nitrospiraceae bacterium]|nr:MAG: type II secretion system F family protein [Nitrospiraceae bacterium]